jgi:hypothetical protein
MVLFIKAFILIVKTLHIIYSENTKKKINFKNFDSHNHNITVFLYYYYPKYTL